MTTTGKGYYPKTFQQLPCSKEQILTPHAAGRVVSIEDNIFNIQVSCRVCRAQHTYSSRQLPTGYQVYQVRITGEDGPHLPTEFRPVPYVEESFEVIATSSQDAHERAELAHKLNLQGQLTHFYINGTLHLDERF